MRSTLRLFAKVKPGQYLEANTPTGITGLQTHPSPRPSLIVLYNQTLSKLKSFPESSVYRQSTEALTKYRLNILTETKPAGYEEWLEKTKKIVAQEPEAYEHLKQPDGTYAPRLIFGEDRMEWDGKTLQKMTEGPQSVAEMKKKARIIEDASEEQTVVKKSLEVEPPLDATQISDIESRIGAGLIEEVLQVAEGELILIDEMTKSKPWEPLVEKPVEGQWKYFERGTHTGTAGPKS